jgi:hypothetical protein
MNNQINVGLCSGLCLSLGCTANVAVAENQPTTIQAKVEYGADGSLLSIHPNGVEKDSITTVVGKTGDKENGRIVAEYVPPSDIKTMPKTTTFNPRLMAGFENGFESTACWITEVLEGDGMWYRTDAANSSNPSVVPYSGSYMAMYNSYYATYGSTTLLFCDASTYIPEDVTDVNLSLWMYHDTGYSSSDDGVHVLISTGGDWYPVGNWIDRYNGNTGWEPASINIDDYKGSTVYVGFLGWSSFGRNQYIDDISITWQEPIVQHPLTVTKTGNGTVTASGINCGTDCSEMYDEYTEVTLTATPMSGSRFSQWGGACYGTATTCTVTMNDSKNVTAAFVLNTVKDFIVTNIVLTPATPAVNTAFSAAVTVKNQGTAAGNAGYLDVWTNLAVAPGCRSEGNKWLNVGTLAAGASVTKTFTGLASRSGSGRTFRAVIDSSCVTPESNEGNNHKIKSY